MTFWGATKSDIEENFLKMIFYLTVTIVSLGVLMWLSLTYLYQGSTLILLGAAIGFIGWGGAKFFPAFLEYYDIYCPACSGKHEVSNHATKFSCEYCGEKLFGKKYWRTKKPSYAKKELKNNSSFHRLEIPVKEKKSLEFKKG